eukprot:1366398-Amphidinium_carterae.2
MLKVTVSSLGSRLLTSVGVVAHATTTMMRLLLSARPISPHSLHSEPVQQGKFMLGAGHADEYREAPHQQTCTM